MPHVIGIDIGGSTTAAALCRWRAGAWSDARSVPLGAGSATIPTVLTLSPDGEFLAGGTGAADAGRTVRGFARRVGDDVPLVVGGEPYRAQDLTATLARWVVDRIEEWEGEAAEQVVLAHPAGWGPYRQELLYDALWQIGLGDVVLVAAPLAAAEVAAAAGRLPISGVLAGYALGGSGCTASVVARTDRAALDLLGHAESGIGGGDLDDALLARVLAAVGARIGDVRTDPAAHRAMSRLRRDCTAAREGLSTALATAARVPVPGAPGELSVPYAEFVELIRPALQATVDTLLGVVRSCGVEPPALSGVLLTGGASQTPLVAELIGAGLPCPVLRDPDPAIAVAKGAALRAGRLAIDRYAAEPEPWTHDPDAPSIPVPASHLVGWAGAEPPEPPPRPPVRTDPPQLDRSARAGRGTRHAVRPLSRLRSRR